MAGILSGVFRLRICDAGALQWHTAAAASMIVLMVILGMLMYFTPLARAARIAPVCRKEMVVAIIEASVLLIGKAAGRMGFMLGTGMVGKTSAEGSAPISRAAEAASSLYLAPGRTRSRLPPPLSSQNAGC